MNTYKKCDILTLIAIIPQTHNIDNIKSNTFSSITDKRYSCYYSIYIYAHIDLIDNPPYLWREYG